MTPDELVELTESRTGRSPCIMFAERKKGFQARLSAGGLTKALVDRSGASLSMAVSPDHMPDARGVVAWADAGGSTGSNPEATMGPDLRVLAQQALEIASGRLDELPGWQVPQPDVIQSAVAEVSGHMLGDSELALRLSVAMEAWDQWVLTASAAHGTTFEKRSLAFGYVVALMTGTDDYSIGIAPFCPSRCPESLHGDIETAAQRAVSDAAELCDAGSPDKTEYTVVFEPHGPAEAFVHEALGHCLEARHGSEGVFWNKIGAQVAGPDLTLVEDPAEEGSPVRYVRDDEGVPARRLTLISQGVVGGFMHDRHTATILGEEPNGHGRRGSYRMPALARMANTIVLPGEHEDGDLLDLAGHGLIINRALSGRAAVFSGEFSMIVLDADVLSAGRSARKVKNFVMTGRLERCLPSCCVGRTSGNPLVGTCGLSQEQTVFVATRAPRIMVPNIRIAGALTLNQVAAMLS